MKRTNVHRQHLLNAEHTEHHGQRNTPVTPIIGAGKRIDRVRTATPILFASRQVVVLLVVLLLPILVVLRILHNCAVTLDVSAYVSIATFSLFSSSPEALVGTDGAGCNREALEHGARPRRLPCFPSQLTAALLVPAVLPIWGMILPRIGTC